MQLTIPLPASSQVLFGFIIDSMEGTAIHSQGADKNQLILTLHPSTLPELQTFCAAWNGYYINQPQLQLNLEAIMNTTNISYELHSPGEICNV
ncbi:MAG: hypothetical protein GX294_08175 [Candidatus Cloacimonetes bacterium]|nr:hypothetical protein [Candidatus Cloacimonadota bacterium]